MTSYQYSTIEEGEKDPLASSPSPVAMEERRSPRLLAMMGAFAVGALVVFAMTSHNNNRSPAAAAAATANVPMLGATKTRSCTFDECYSANCNFKVAPFICLLHNGGPHGGCSPVPWSAFTCDDDCDLSGCDSLDIPKDTKSCEGVECGKEWCAGGQVCPSAAPYQCMDGSSRFGCNSDPYQWTLRSPGPSCSKCCDSSLCP